MFAFKKSIPLLVIFSFSPPIVVGFCSYGNGRTNVYDVWRAGDTRAKFVDTHT